MKRCHGWLLVALAGGFASDSHATDRPPSLVITPPALAPLPPPARGNAPASVDPDVPRGPVSSPGPVELDIEERIVRYAVPGHDLDALRAALADQALAEEAGGSHGRTRSDIRIRFKPTPVEGGCVADDAAIAVVVTTTLPEWEPGLVVQSGLRERWQAMAASLQGHEARHRDHALDAVRELQSLLSGLGVQRDCHALRVAADRAFLQVTLRAEFLDRRYDERTRNGVEEGIVF